MNRRTGFVLLAIAAIIASVALLWPKPVVAPDTPGYERANVLISGVTINADIADTEALRELGLSGRAGLFENQGMLFVFQNDDYHAFWMKDMLFPIDMIWISNDKKVVSIAADAAPESYPSSFMPDAKARYVLEVPAGFAKRHGITKGSTVSF